MWYFALLSGHMQQIYIKNTIKKYFIYIHLHIHYGDHVLAAYTYCCSNYTFCLFTPRPTALLLFESL